MRVVPKSKFERDVLKIRKPLLLEALYQKIEQMEKASSIDNVTGVKILRGYTHHHRIIVKSEKESYRIGAIIRANTIWLVRFLPRRTIYKEFP